MTTASFSLSLLTALAISPLAQAATISWGAPFNFNHSDESLWLNSFDASRNGGLAGNSPLLSTTAENYGYTGNVTINGVTFTGVSGSTDYWGSTGINPNIDQVLSGHKSLASGVTTGTLVLTDLIVGHEYQIQLIVAHDNRTAIWERQYEVSFGGEDFTSGGVPPVLTRAAYGNVDPANPPTFQDQVAYGTVVGSFVADATTQAIALRSNTQDGVTTDDPDPAITGFILLHQIPEPSALFLALFACPLAWRRLRR